MLDITGVIPLKKFTLWQCYVVVYGFLFLYIGIFPVLPNP